MCRREEEEDGDGEKKQGEEEGIEGEDEEGEEVGVEEEEEGEGEEDDEEEEIVEGEEKEENKEGASSLLPFLGELAVTTWFAKLGDACMVVFVVGGKPAEAGMMTTVWKRLNKRRTRAWNDLGSRPLLLSKDTFA